MPWCVPSTSAGNAERDVEVAECRQPRPASRARSYNIPEMKPTLVQFEAPVSGVGEVWLERGRVFHTELPRPRRTRPVSDTGDGSKGATLARKAGRVLRRRSADDVRRRRARLAGRVLRRLRPRARGRAARRGRHLRRARRCSPATRAPRARRARSARAARSSPFIPTHRVVGATGSARTATRASSTSGGCSRSKGDLMSLSDELRDELAQIAPPRQLLPARRAVGALPRRRCLAPARARRVAVHLDLGELGGRTPRLRAAARPRRPLGDPHLPPAGVRPCDALPAARRGRRAARSTCCARRACSRRRGAPLERPPQARRRPLVLPRRLPPRRAARRRLAVRARATRISSCGPRRVAGARVHRRGGRARGREAGASSSGGTTRSPTRRGTRRSATCSRSRAPGEIALALEEHAVVAGDAVAREQARERRRGEPRAHRAGGAPRSSRRSRRSTPARCRAPARGDRRASAAPPVRLAARAGREGAAAADEGRRPPAAAMRWCAWRTSANLTYKCSSATPRAIPILIWRFALVAAADTDPVRRRSPGRVHPEGEVVLGAPSPDRQSTPRNLIEVPIL